MHITHPQSGVMVTTGIVGAGMPIANGLGLAAAARRDRRRSRSSTSVTAPRNIGAFHEALNMASVWKLPVIFVCQNNRYGEHTPYRMATNVAVHQRAGRARYGMPGVTVDGNDPARHLYAAMGEAIDRARAGDGPTLVEARTFRFHGHLMGDAMGYMAQGRARGRDGDADPVPALPRLAGGQRPRDRATELACDRGSDRPRAIDDAVDFAMDSPFPDESELCTDVFADDVATGAAR